MLVRGMVHCGGGMGRTLCVACIVSSIILKINNCWCQWGPVGAEIGTLEPVAGIRPKVKNSWLSTGPAGSENLDRGTLGPAACSSFGLANKNIHPCVVFVCRMHTKRPPEHRETHNHTEPQCNGCRTCSCTRKQFCFVGTDIIWGMVTGWLCTWAVWRGVVSCTNPQMGHFPGTRSFRVCVIRFLSKWLCPYYNTCCFLSFLPRSSFRSPRHPAAAVLVRVGHTKPIPKVGPVTDP